MLAEFMAEFVIGGIAAYSAWKAKRAEQHTKPTNGATLAEVMNRVEKMANNNVHMIRQMDSKMDSTLEWQGEHDSHHTRLRAQYLPALDALVTAMQDDLDFRIAHDDAEEDDH